MAIMIPNSRVRSRTLMKMVLKIPGRDEHADDDLHHMRPPPIFMATNALISG